MQRLRVGRRILGEAGISENTLLERIESAQTEYFKARQENANKDLISQRYGFFLLASCEIGRC